MAKSGQTYCPMHLLSKNVHNYDSSLDIDYSLTSTTDRTTPEVVNSIIKKISVGNLSKVNRATVSGNASTGTLTSTSTSTLVGLGKKSPTVPGAATLTGTMREQKASTVISSNKETEDELEIKLLILVNDDEYVGRIPKLVGPVFRDVTVSEDEEDPITMDPIWTWSNGQKVPASINRYYLFSYVDSKGKIRCLTIFTLYNLIQQDNLIHPTTTEAIPKSDIKRGRLLIEIYQSKIDLFKNDDSNLSQEYKLKNRLTKLFKQFHQHSVYLEDSWFINLRDRPSLYKIVSETDKLVSNNMAQINSTLRGFKIMQRKSPLVRAKMAFDHLEMQVYIVSEWEKLVDAALDPNNQLPMWIIVWGLSTVVPAIKEKFPDLQLMLG